MLVHGVPSVFSVLLYGGTLLFQLGQDKERKEKKAESKKHEAQGLENLAHHSKKDLKGQSPGKFLFWDFPRKVTVSRRQLYPNLQKVKKDKIMGSGERSF